MNIDYNEMKLWVNNDYALHQAFLESKLPISRFIKKNQVFIRRYIKDALGIEYKL